MCTFSNFISFRLLKYYDRQWLLAGWLAEWLLHKLPSLNIPRISIVIAPMRVFLQFFCVLFKRRSLNHEKSEKIRDKETQWVDLSDIRRWWNTISSMPGICFVSSSKYRVWVRVNYFKNYSQLFCHTSSTHRAQLSTHEESVFVSEIRMKICWCMRVRRQFHKNGMKLKKNGFYPVSRLFHSNQ